MKDQVQNCNVGKIFDVDVQKRSFPVCGCGVVYQEYCNEETSSFPCGYADLCTDGDRRKLLCHNIMCINIKAEGN